MEKLLMWTLKDEWNIPGGGITRDKALSKESRDVFNQTCLQRGSRKQNWSYKLGPHGRTLVCQAEVVHLICESLSCWFGKDKVQLHLRKLIYQWCLG